LGFIIGAVILLFIVRLFYVFGKAKSKRDRISFDSCEIYSLCKSKGMDVNDIRSVEFDLRAMAWVKERLSALNRSPHSVGQPRNALIANCVYDAWKRKEKSFVVYAVMNWGVTHGLPQFVEFLNSFTKGDPFSISDDDMEKVYNLETLSAEVGIFGRDKPITSIPDAVFRLPKLERLYFGKGGYPEYFSVALEGIPESIKEARSLKYLHLQHCGLKELPRQIFTPWLEELKIGGNDIKIIPDSIGCAKSLRMLTAWNNDLEYISEKIGDLKNLKRLDLGQNPCLKLPNSIIKLGEMEDIYIDENLPGLTSEQRAWIKRNMYRDVRETESNEDIPF
jgi:hypothetical protein